METLRYELHVKNNTLSVTRRLLLVNILLGT
jgi:hypothetical protein